MAAETAEATAAATAAIWAAMAAPEFWGEMGWAAAAFDQPTWQADPAW